MKGGAAFNGNALSPIPRNIGPTHDSACIDCAWFDHVMSQWTHLPAKSANNSLLMHSCNINSWRKNGAKVCDLLSTDSLHLLCLQETATSREQQRSATAALNRQGLHAIWGAPTPSPEESPRVDDGPQ